MQLDHGTCLNCLLREGLEAKGEASREMFENILLEANVTDTQWRLGHYEILEEIGRGGMGVIYRARQQHSRRIVAVKRIFAHDVNSHETLVRFRREAEAVASLDHPNILPIHEISESDEGLPFFSMKYATGGSLRAAAPALRNKPRECVRLMAKVARGIAYAHSKGVLHRDLQPGNILLDENGEPMVSDFGLAKWLDQTSDLTRTLETLGTPGYIAPEQAELPNRRAYECCRHLQSGRDFILPPYWAASLRRSKCSFCHSSGCCNSGATFAFTGSIARPRSRDNGGSLLGERSKGALPIRGSAGRGS